jgi:hypothetical protein
MSAALLAALVQQYRGEHPNASLEIFRVEESDGACALP